MIVCALLLVITFVGLYLLNSKVFPTEQAAIEPSKTPSITLDPESNQDRDSGNFSGIDFPNSPSNPHITADPDIYRKTFSRIEGPTTTVYRGWPDMDTSNR